jgi:hypothetical protein
MYTDAPFFMPGFMPGDHDMDDLFSASDGKLYDVRDPTSKIPASVQFFNISIKGEDEDALTQTTNANRLGNCIKYLSSNYDD